MKKLQMEVESLRARLEEAEENLRAIRNGEVDALVVSGPRGDQVFALKDANHPYRLIIEEMEEGAITLTKEGSILYSNRQFAAMVNKPLWKIFSSSIYDFLDKTNGRIVKNLLKQGSETSGKAEISFNQAGKKGRLQAYVSFRPLEIEDRMLFSGVVTDITRLREGERIRIQLAAAIEQSVDCVFITDLKGIVHYANPAGQNLLGVSPDRILGRTIDFLGTHKGKKFSKCILSGLKTADVWKGRVKGDQKSRAPYELEVTARTIRDPGGRPTSTVILGNDLTHELQLQEQLRHMQRMEGIGRMAGGIAHDMNNILYPIIMNSGSLLSEAEPGSEVQQGLESILRAAFRQRDLVRQILLFSRKAEQKESPIRVGRLVREAISFLRSSLPSNIKMELNASAENDTILGDPTQIHQIIMNLFSNAVDAIRPGSGTITISLDNVELKDGKPPHLKPGRCLEMRFADTGCAMGRSVMGQIFDPFFTTKAPGRGTGMGLAVVHGIINNHGGTVEVRSKPGKGSQFDIFFPLVKVSVPEKHNIPHAFEAPGSGRLLLVDDEEPVVISVRNALRRNGYTVDAATDSLEALELFHSNPGSFDLVITDQTMPHMTGLELASELVKVRPDIPIILSTGYSETINKEEAASRGIREILMKPASLKELTDAVRRALAGRPKA